MSIPPIPRKRGRPRKNPLPETVTPTKPAKVETDAQIIKRLSERFNLLHNLSVGVTKGEVRSVIISGAPGVGKTYTVESVLTVASDTRGVKYEVVKGMVTPINLYKLLYRNRGCNYVVVLDDADSIFMNEDGLNILKAALDTSPVRHISWLSDSASLTMEEIPSSFVYEGSMMFLTNLDFQKYVDAPGKNRFTPHFSALLSRSLYLDLQLHEHRELMVWIRHIVNRENLLVKLGVTKTEQTEIVEWLLDNFDNLRSLSIRTCLQCVSIFKMDPKTWKTIARALLNKHS